MPIATIWDLELGAASATREPTIAPAVYGVIARPQPLPPQSFWNWTVGGLSVNSYLTIKSTGVLASGQIPIVPVLENESEKEEEVEKAANAVIDLIRKELMIKFGSGMKEKEGTIPFVTTLDDELVPTWDKVPYKGITFWRDRLQQYIAAEPIWFTYTLAKIQTAITQYLLRQKSIYPEPRMVGIGMVSAKDGQIKVERRVSDRIQWDEKQHKGKFRLVTDRWTTMQKRDQYLMLMLCAKALERLLPKTVGKATRTYGKYFSTNDMIANINELLLNFSPPGEPGIDHPYNADTIMENILSSIGMGMSESDRYLLNTQSALTDWLTFCIVFGIISARTKGTVGDCEVRIKASVRLLPNVVNLFEHIFGEDGHQYDLPGGATSPWHPMSRNIIQAYDIPMPMIVAEEDNDGTISANDYAWLRKPKCKFDKVEVRAGQVSKVLVEPLPTEEVRRTISVHYDTQRYTIPRIDRDIILWAMKYIQVLANSDMPDGQRRFNWFFGMYTAGNSCYARGYGMAPSMKMFSMQPVSYSSTPMGEVTVEKEVTGTEGAQEPAPAGIPLNVDAIDGKTVGKSTKDGKDLGTDEKTLKTGVTTPNIRGEN